jgi:thiol-disulfide isomerase/thioredoxin
MIRLIITHLIIWNLFFCSYPINGKYQNNQTAEAEEQVLYGKVSSEEIYSSFPEWKNEELMYLPDSVIIEQINSIQGNWHIKIFFGSWCSDSEREIPRFLKIWKQARLIHKVPVEFYAVDRNKQEKDNLQIKYDIQYVPTFIFFKDNIEVDRIIEYPENSLEYDIYLIFGNKPE